MSTSVRTGVIRRARGVLLNRAADFKRGHFFGFLLNIFQQGDDKTCTFREMYTTTDPKPQTGRATSFVTEIFATAGGVVDPQIFLSCGLINMQNLGALSHTVCRRSQKFGVTGYRPLRWGNQLSTGQMAFPSPHQQRQSTEGVEGPNVMLVSIQVCVILMAEPLNQQLSFRP